MATRTDRESISPASGNRAKASRAAFMAGVSVRTSKARCTFSDKILLAALFELNDTVVVSVILLIKNVEV